MKIIDSLAIRDANAHESSISENLIDIIKTYIIENSLNQAVSIQWLASANEDFSNSFSVSSPLDVAASTNTYVSCSNYFPYVKVIATCAVAPSSGTLTVHIFKYYGAG